MQLGERPDHPAEFVVFDVVAEAVVEVADTDCLWAFRQLFLPF